MALGIMPQPISAKPALARSPGAYSLAELNSILLAIYEPNSTANHWQDCLEKFRKHFAASQVFLVARSTKTGQPRDMVSCGDEPNPESRRLYLGRFGAIDPLANLPPGRARTIRDVMSEEQWVSSEFYKQYLKSKAYRYCYNPQKSSQVLGADIVCSDDLAFGLRLCRRPSGDSFSDKDCFELEFLLPHMQRLFENKVNQSTLSASQGMLTDIVDGIGLGVVMLDQEGKIIKANRSAITVSDMHGGLHLANGVMRADNQHDNEKLQRLIGQALHSSAHNVNGAVGTFGIVNIESGRVLGVAVRSLANNDLFPCARRASVCVLFRDGLGDSQLSPSVLGSVFGLTQSESKIAVALAKGLSVDEAAQELGVSRNTIRTHLNGLFIKTGTNRQSEVVRALLGSIASFC